MRVSVFGVGYVGTVAAACLARDGHSVIAVDINPHKVAALNRGEALILEPGLDALISRAVAEGRLKATSKAEDAVLESDLSIVAVGTPSAPDGHLDLDATERVATAIGEALARKAEVHTVVVRSTLPPGAVMGRIAPLIEAASGLKAGAGFGLAYQPEFLREGSAIRDYDDPSLSIVAATDAETLARLSRLQPQSAALPLVVSFEEAEAIKLVSNAFHGLKVSFANEIGGILSAYGVDAHRVMDAVCQDRRLNISPAYLTPGFAFGGSCLPKDIRAFKALGAAKARGTSMLEATLRANEAVLTRAFSLVEAAGRRRVSVIGLAFKPGADDLRESPYVALAAHLIEAGYDVRLFDPAVRVEALTGANLAHATDRLPNLETLLCPTLQAAMAHGETLLLSHPEVGAQALDLTTENQVLIDLVRVRPHLRSGGNYIGLHW